MQDWLEELQELACADIVEESDDDADAALDDCAYFQ